MEKKEQEKGGQAKVRDRKCTNITTKDGQSFAFITLKLF
jgi:hypothetical protein